MKEILKIYTDKVKQLMEGEIPSDFIPYANMVDELIDKLPEDERSFYKRASGQARMLYRAMTVKTPVKES